MKIDQLITAYLFSHQQVYLPSIGFFTLEPPPTPDGSPVIEFHPQSSGDITALIDFIVERTGKMRVVAEGDIRCFCYEIQEMLNIHQPFAIHGIGTLSRSLDGKIHFEQEPFLPEKKNHIDHDSGKNMLIPKKPEDPPIKWGNTSYALNYHRLWLIGIFALLLGGLIILANSHTRMQMSDPEPSSKIIESSLSPNISDNLSEVSDQIKIPSTPTKISYLVVFEISDSTRAHKRYNQLTSWGDQIVIFKWDDRRYALASPFTTPPADTLHAKDSISTLFGRSVFIQYLSSSMNQKELTRIEN